MIRLTFGVTGGALQMAPRFALWPQAGVCDVGRRALLGAVYRGEIEDRPGGDAVFSGRAQEADLGARGRIRTGMASRPGDFKSLVSTVSPPGLAPIVAPRPDAARRRNGV